MKSVFSSNYAGNLMYYRSILKADNYCIDLFEKIKNIAIVHFPIPLILISSSRIIEGSLVLFSEHICF